MSGLALGACGSRTAATTTAATTATVPSTATATLTTTTPTTTTTTSTIATSTFTVVGTAPDHQTVTAVNTQVSTTPAGPDGFALQTGQPLGPITKTTTGSSTTTTTGSSTSTNGGSTSATTGTQSTGTSTTPPITGQTIDRIQCNRLTQRAYDAAVHLQVYVDGHSRALPGGIGLVSPVAGSTGTVTTYSQSLCTYWLRTRASNGLIEIDSPTPARFTLGEFFDIWGQPLSAHRVADARGRVTAIVNGRRWHGNPRAIPLREHEAIQLAVGRPVPRFRPVHWPANL